MVTLAMVLAALPAQSAAAATPAVAVAIRAAVGCSWNARYIDHGIWFELLVSHCAAQKLVTRSSDINYVAGSIAVLLPSPQMKVATVAAVIMQVGFTNRVRDNDHGNGVNLSSLKWNAPFPFLWAIQPY